MSIRTQMKKWLSATLDAITSYELIWKTTEQGSEREPPSSTLSTLQYKSSRDESIGTRETSTGSSEPTLPSTASDAPPRKPDALFIWYRGFYGKPLPQIIRDIQMFEYQVESNRIPVIQRRDITEAEASLGIDKLSKLYPCETHNDDDDRKVRRMPDK